MPAYSSIELYLSEKHPNFYTFFEYTGLPIDDITTVIVPNKKVLESLAAKYNNPKRSRKDLQEVTTQLATHLIYVKIQEPYNTFPGGEVGNKAKQSVKISPIDSKGNFTIDSGSKYEVTTECCVAKDFESPLPRSGTAPRPLFVGIMSESASPISANGNQYVKKKMNKKEALGQFFGGDFQRFASTNLAEKKKIFMELLEKTKDNIKNGKSYNPITAVIAGLMKWIMDDCPNASSEDCEKAKILVSTLASYDTLGMYLVLFQPFGPHQFIPNSFTDEHWKYAPDSTSDNYCSLMESFCDKYCPSDCDKRNEEAQKIRNQIYDKCISTDFLSHYEKCLIAVFGNNYLNHIQKLWADEFLFNSYKKFCSCCSSSPEQIINCMDEIVKMAEFNYSGENYHNECVYCDSTYWENYADKDAVKNPIEFLNSDFFIKCKLCDPQCKCKEWLQKCCCDQSYARAFCLINGSF